MFFGQGAQRCLKPVQTSLNVHSSSPVIAKAPPFRASRHMGGCLKAEVTSKASQIIGLTKRPGGPKTVTIEVQIWQEQAKPLHETGKAHVARLPHLFHRPMQVLQAAVKVTCGIGDATFGDADGGLIQEGQIFRGHLGKFTLANRFHDGFWEALKQLCGFGRQPPLVDALEPLNGPLHATPARPAKAIDFHTILVDEDRGIPVMEEAHVATSTPWAKTLRSVS